MRIKFKITALIVFIITVSLGAIFLKTNGLKENQFVRQKKLVTIQLVPLPIVVKNTLQQDNILHKLLLDKKPTQITFPKVNLDIEPIFLFAPSYLKNLSIYFTFNKETDRVEFQGRSNTLNHIKIQGHYSLTPKNHIQYHLIIHDNDKTWIINSTYAPAYKDNESEYKEVITGNFLLKTPDLLKPLYNANNITNDRPKLPLTLQADFIKGENFLDIKNLYLNAKELEANINAKIENKNLLLDIALNDINIEDISSYISRSEIDKVLYSIFQTLKPLNVNGSLNCSGLNIHGIRLNSLVALFSKNKKTKNNLEISTLKFSFPDNSIFNSFGKISHSGANIAIDGSFNITDLHTNILSKLLNIKNYNNKNLASISSEFELTSTNLKLKNFKLKEGLTTAAGNLSFSKYISSKILRGDIEINNYDTETISLIQLMLYGNSLLSKTHTLDYEVFLERNKKRNFLKDITLKLFNTKTSAGTVKKISTRYLETSDSISLKYFKAKDQNFTVQGNINFHVKEYNPHLTVKFEGDKVNMSIFNDLIIKPLIYLIPETRDSNNTHILSTLKFSETTGDVSIKLKNPDKNSSLSQVDCTASLDKHILTLNTCTINLFDSDAYLEGVINLSNILGYNINFSHKNANVGKLTKWLFKGNKKITGGGNIDMEGNIYASDFNTNKEMLHALKGTIKVKSDQINLTDIDIKSLTFKYGKIKNIAVPKKKKETLFHNVIGTFNLSNGTMVSKNLSFITKDNIHGKTNLNYKLGEKNTTGVLSLAYFTKTGKIDGFNIVFYGDIRKLDSRLGIYTTQINN